MKKLYTLLLTLSLSTVATHAATKTLSHKIKSGDSLYLIAQKNHTTVEQIRKANSMKQGETLKLGRVLKIPTKTSSSEKTAPKKIVSKKPTSTQASLASTSYKIQKGDSLFTIAQKHHTTVENIRKANGMKASEKLKLGRVLEVPQSPKAKSAIVQAPQNKQKIKIAQTKKTTSKQASLASTSYKIQKGDSLFTIAQKHHTTVENIRKANGMKASEKLRLGRVLEVPQSPKAKSAIVQAPQNKQKIKIAQTKKTTTNKKLVASIATLDTITLEKSEAKKDDKRNLGDILFGGGKGKSVKLVETDKSLDSDKCVRITSLAKKKLGNRYVWGATGGRNTFDCSGLTTYVYRQNGIKLPRRAIAQAQVGKRVKRENLKKGDLVFFDTSKRRKGYVNHVGIYIGDNKFIHASSAKKKVIITSLNEPFYRNRFTGARRLES